MALSLLFSQGFANPQSAQAGLGVVLFGQALFTGGPGYILGPVLGLIGVETFLIGAKTGSHGFSNHQGFWTRTGYVALGVAIAAAGVFLLDEQTQSMSFVPLTDASAEKLLLTRDERQAYDAELIEVNTVVQSLASDVNEYAARNIGVSNEQIAEFSQARWAEYRNALSPLTLSALGKVGESLNH